MSSTAPVGDGLALFDHRIGYSHNRTGDFVSCPGMGSVGRGPSIGQCYRSFDGHELLLWPFVLDPGR